MLDKIKDVFKNEKKTIIIICVLLIAGIVAWDVFSPVVSNNGSGTDAIRAELDSVKQYQLDAGKRLDEIETGLGASADRVGRVSERIITNTDRTIEVERRIETSQAGLAESGRIIADSKSILDQIRKRGDE